MSELNLQEPMHLELVLQQPEGPPRPIERVYLRPGALSPGEDGLPPGNLSMIPLPPEAFGCRHELTGYRLWDQPSGGQVLRELPLEASIPMDELLLGALPPCCLDLSRELQRPFMARPLLRNPCPAWRERIHLYQDPSKPFEASCIVYLATTGEAASVELFNVVMRGPTQGLARRCWILLKQ